MRTMTIEGRPELNVDWKAEYAKQRKNRLADSIFEYLQDDEVPLEVFYEDLTSELKDVIAYHERMKSKASSVLELFLGHRKIDTIDLGLD